MSSEKNEILLCYRGRYGDQVVKLAGMIRKIGLKVSFDNEILAEITQTNPNVPVPWFRVSEPPEAKEKKPEESPKDLFWRGPLHHFIEKSQLIVFLIDPTDISENVLNEIIWTAQSGKFIFIVFDVLASSVSVETESLFVSMIQTQWMFATGKWEYPLFGYHVIAHNDPVDIDKRLEVLVNRICTYLEDALSGKVKTGKIDHDITYDYIRNNPWEKARSQLRHIQEKMSLNKKKEQTNEENDLLQEALAFQRKFEEGAVIEKGRIRPPGSAFTYHYDTEIRRFKKTEDIIQRIRPGMHESIPLFSTLARQAATIEMYLPELAEKQITLFGTIPATSLIFLSDVIKEPGYNILLVNASFNDFVYQIIKATVQSWKLTSGPEKIPGAFQIRKPDILNTLESRPELVDNFYNCLLQYVVRGLPGETTSGAPLPVYQAPLSILVSLADRFMLAHGYARIFLSDPSLYPEHFHLPKPIEDFSLSDWITQSDLFAATITMRSAMDLDEVDPMVALQSCLITMNCLDVIRKAVDYLDPSFRDPGAVCCPPIGERRSRVENIYKQLAMNTGISEGGYMEKIQVSQEAVGTVLFITDIIQKRLKDEAVKGLTPSLLWK